MSPNNRKPQALAPARRGALRFAGVCGALCLVASSPALAESVEAFAQRLATLRGEVEALSGELSSLTAEGRDEQRSLARQKADLELELKKEETRAAKIQAAVGQKRQVIEKDQGRDAKLAPAFERNLELVRGYVKRSLPFRRDERMAALEKLEGQVKSGLLTAPKGLSRLWTFVEDEFRLSRENGLYQQTITIEGNEQLADVVRVGAVMLLFKTQDGQVGFARLDNGRYAYQVLDNPEEQKQVRTLFDSFRKQIRAGYFQLPNTIANPKTAAVAPNAGLPVPPKPSPPSTPATPAPAAPSTTPSEAGK